MTHMLSTLSWFLDSVDVQGCSVDVSQLRLRHIRLRVWIRFSVDIRPKDLKIRLSDYIVRRKLGTRAGDEWTPASSAPLLCRPPVAGRR